MLKSRTKYTTWFSGRFEYFVSFLVTQGFFERQNRTLPSQMDTVKRILVVNLAHLGDVIHSTPLLRRCRKLFPGAHISFLGGEWGHGVLQGHPDVDECIQYNSNTFNRGKSRLSPAQTIRILSGLRTSRYDLIVDLCSDMWVKCFAPFFRSRFRLDMPSVRVRQHLVSGRLHDPVLKEIHYCTRQTAVFEHLGAVPGSDRPSLVVDSDARDSMISKLKKLDVRPDDFVVILQPFAEWRGREWDLEAFGRVAKWLTKRYGAKVVVTGKAEDTGRASPIFRIAGNGVIDLVGKTDLKEFVALISLARLFLGVDGGGVHIATALSVPVVTLFGPQSPSCFGPFSRTARVLYHRFECSPCRQYRCSKSPTCMDAITIEEVQSALAESIEKDVSVVGQR